MPSLPLTPQQAADQVLATAGPSTVSVERDVTVAGEAAYQLVLAPKSSSSLIGQVRIAIDAVHRVPLRVQVFAKGAASPALQIGFTAISFGRPAAANFAFRPPAGATVVQQTIGSSSKAGSTGSPGTGNAGTGNAGTGIAAGSSVIGTGWLAVADLPLSALTGTAQSASTSGGATLGIGTDVIFNGLLQSAKHVSGPWGSGRLLRTSLVSMLVTSNGRVLIGAVTPAVLYQAAAQ